MQKKDSVVSLLENPVDEVETWVNTVTSSQPQCTHDIYLPNIPKRYSFVKPSSAFPIVNLLTSDAQVLSIYTPSLLPH